MWHKPAEFHASDPCSGLRSVLFSQFGTIRVVVWAARSLVVCTCAVTGAGVCLYPTQNPLFSVQSLVQMDVRLYRYCSSVSSVWLYINKYDDLSVSKWKQHQVLVSLLVFWRKTLNFFCQINKYLYFCMLTLELWLYLRCNVVHDSLGECTQGFLCSSQYNMKYQIQINQ